MSAADTIAPPRVSEGDVWRWLEAVPDPEVPAVSVVDLGMIREVKVAESGAATIVVTPTYSGCPATRVIAFAIEAELRARGLGDVTVEQRIFPPWTTDWITEEGREKLRAYGIAPPVGKAGDFDPLARLSRERPAIACPHCGAGTSERISEFGSTPCKAQYRCLACREPFDYFKCV